MTANHQPATSAPAAPALSKFLKGGEGHAVIASFLGWTLDAFDFFVVVFLVETLATRFAVSKAAIVLTLTATLATRPIGALLFGLLADRFGRRRPLMVNVIYFSVIELACGFAPNFTVFLVLRALYGIGMGGEWGVGASLAMETAPRRWRGLLSGVLQSGYPIGYLLAALAARFLLPLWGWRSMFFAGACPALLALYVRSKVPESEAWRRVRHLTFGGILRTVAENWKTAAYLVLLMTLMNCLSHGTQDLYPDFLKTAHGAASATVALVAMLYNLGAVAGGISFGHFSERLGRRRTMLVALALALAVIPLWAFGARLASLALGAFLMQAGVQGAWGIIPAHLNELAPDAARGLLPGLCYQLGILIASPTNSIEYALRDRLGYGWAMAAFEVGVIALGALVISLGRERRGKDFLEPGLEPAVLAGRE
jgi:SHS family lactate transporter-like MFS transporter